MATSCERPRPLRCPTGGQGTRRRRSADGRTTVASITRDSERTPRIQGFDKHLHSAIMTANWQVEGGAKSLGPLAQVELSVGRGREGAAWLGAQAPPRSQ